MQKQEEKQETEEREADDRGMRMLLLHRSTENYTRQLLSLIQKNNLDAPTMTIWRMSFAMQVNSTQIKRMVKFLIENKLIIPHVVKSRYNTQYRTTYLLTKLGEKYLAMIQELHGMLAKPIQSK